MTLYAEVRSAALAAPTGDPKIIAGHLIKKLKTAGLVALLAAEIAGEQRKIAGAAESSVFQQAFQHRFRSSGDTPTVHADSSAFRALFSTPFSLGNGDKVEWGQATVQQHEERIAYLEKLRDGLNVTIERHRYAVRLCRDAGVACLADIADGKAEAA